MSAKPASKLDRAVEAIRDARACGANAGTPTVPAPEAKPDGR